MLEPGVTSQVSPEAATVPAGDGLGEALAGEGGEGRSRRSGSLSSAPGWSQQVAGLASRY